MFRIHTGHQLKPLNTMGIDGTVDTYVEWSSAADLHCLFTGPDLSHVVRQSFKSIGSGSNMLFTRYRVHTPLLRCVNDTISLVSETDTDVILTVSAGCELDRLVEHTCYNGWWGLENLSLIPGTVGGATVQNVGAYGVEFGNRVVSVTCYDTETDRTIDIPVCDMAYGYRDSALKHSPLSKRMIVVWTTLRLSKCPAPVLTYGRLSEFFADRDEQLSPVDVRDEIIRTRRAKLPDVGITGSAGSFFKNPVVSADEYNIVLSNARRLGIDTSAMPVHHVTGPDGEPLIKLSAAWFIDKSGWKGYRRWNVGTWPGQPLVLVNITGYAAGIEIQALAADIIADISDKWGITLTPEVEYIK
ncbi:MAG: UDP-N-acetylmuramate dehydrogenase [Muribaculaceae bacterium]|nr:UDP-N-acetylmuramate dehydrogenase [Muribaculaceae bacterium]